MLAMGVLMVVYSGYLSAERGAVIELPLFWAGIIATGRAARSLTILSNIFTKICIGSGVWIVAIVKSATISGFRLFLKILSANWDCRHA